MHTHACVCDACMHACAQGHARHTQQFRLDVFDARLLIRYRTVWVLRAACEYAFHVVTGRKCPACMCGRGTRAHAACAHTRIMYACVQAPYARCWCGPGQHGEGAALAAAMASKTVLGRNGSCSGHSSAAHARAHKHSDRKSPRGRPHRRRSMASTRRRLPCCCACRYAPARGCMHARKAAQQRAGFRSKLLPTKRRIAG